MRELNDPDINLTESDKFVANWLVETRARLDAEELARRQLEFEETIFQLSRRRGVLPLMDPDQGFPIRRHREPGEDDE